MQFIYKTYRCEWQAQIVQVDQYGRSEKILESYPFATRDEAEAHLKTLANWEHYLQRWVPFNTNGYTQGAISYKEVLVDK